MWQVCQPAAGGDVLEVIALPPSPDEVAREALVARAALGRHRSASWSAPPQVSATWLMRRTPCDGPPDDDATWGKYVADGVCLNARAVLWRLDPRDADPSEPARLQHQRRLFVRPRSSRAARQEDIPAARYSKLKLTTATWPPT